MLKKLITEYNSSYNNHGHMYIIEILNAIHEEDKKIVPAIKKTILFQPEGNCYVYTFSQSI